MKQFGRMILGAAAVTLGWGQAIRVECLYDAEVEYRGGELKSADPLAAPMQIVAGSSAALLQFGFRAIAGLPHPRAVLILRRAGGGVPRSLQVLPVGLVENASSAQAAQAKRGRLAAAPLRLAVLVAARDLYRYYFAVSAVEQGWLRLPLSAELSAMLAAGKAQGLLVAGIPGTAPAWIHSMESGQGAPYLQFTGYATAQK